MLKDSYKAGIFVLSTLVLLVVMVLRLSQGGSLFSSTYTVFIDVDSAVGLSRNTPVMIAGVQVGTVDDITLSAKNRARLVLEIQDGVQVSSEAEAHIKTTGILGDAYIELHEPEVSSQQVLAEGDNIKKSINYGDFNSLTAEFSLIADDVKAITTQMRKLMAGDGSSFDNSMKNIERITASLAKVTTTNERNLSEILENVRALSQNLNHLVAQNTGRVDRSIYNIESITGSIARGEGTVGRLVKNDETVEKLNDALDGLNDFLGTTNKLQLDLGMHSEYLAGTGDYKNYVSLKIKPRPDKFFLFEAVSDPDPSFETRIEQTTVESGGSSSTINTTRNTKELDAFKFSAQIGKKFHDFTLRGGLIESSGGVGLDYEKGPFVLTFEAYDFKSEADQRPHLKAWGKTYLTKSFYLLGGVDDIINKNQDLAWFVGAGLNFTDDDIKSLLGVAASGL